jgi:small subunit ribosomal protein S17
MSEQTVETAQSGQAEQASARNVRRVVTGTVVSAKAQKTITVLWERQVRHPKTGKFVRRSTKLHAHCEEPGVGEGDLVEVMACRPLSKTKTWRLVNVVRKAHK